MPQGAGAGSKPWEPFDKPTRFSVRFTYSFRTRLPGIPSRNGVGRGTQCRVPHEVSRPFTIHRTVPTERGTHEGSIPMRERIEILQGDITAQHVDAVVNAANTSLLGGGGVDGAIHRAAGPELLEETRTLGGCPTGQARVSKGYRLPAKWVIHTAGPVWRGGGHDEETLLAECYKNCYHEALSLGVESIAFPSISTGAYRFPLEKATEIALAETARVLLSDNTLKTVRFVCFGREVFATYRTLMERLIPG